MMCVSFVSCASVGRLRPSGRRRVSLLRHIFRRIVQELWHALVYAFVLLALCLSWFIGITRFWDNVSVPEPQHGDCRGDTGGVTANAMFELALSKC